MDPLPPPASQPPALPDFIDRSGGLVAFGVLEIIGGGLCALMVPFSLLGQMMVAQKSGAPIQAMAALLGALQFAAMAIALIWLGIGSLKARRWARALLLCLDWLGLAAGLLSLVVVLPTLGSMDEVMRQQGGEIPAGAVVVAQVIAALVVFVMYVAIPGALVLFYRSRHVKRTCEVRDPVERWTDRVPLPVLAMCIVQVFGGACVALMLPQMGGAFPLAGVILTGAVSYLLWIAIIALCFYGAWGFYHLQFRAWAVYLVVVALFSLSWFITLARVDLGEYYRLSGMSEQQVKLITTSPLVRSGGIFWISGLGMALGCGYVLFLRRFFTPHASLGNPPAPAV